MRGSIVATAAVFVLAGGWPAAAQEPGITISGGYMLLHGTDVTLKRGWYADVVLPVNRWWGVVVEGGATYRTETVPYAIAGSVTRGPFLREQFRMYHVLSGVRMRVASATRLEPFAQILMGAVHASVSQSLDDPTASAADRAFFNATYGDTRFALQPGGGIGVQLTDHLGVRGQVDYRRIFAADGGDNETRVAAGLVWRFGR